MAFFYPPVIDTMTFLPGLIHRYRRAAPEERFKAKTALIYRLIQNSLLILIACCGCVAGLNSSIRDLISSNSN